MNRLLWAFHLIWLPQAMVLWSICAWADSLNLELSGFDPRCPDLDLNWEESGDVVVIFSASGGGKRASAYAYGALTELQKISIYPDGNPRTLLHAIKFISGVSGGSVPAGYLKLNWNSTDPLKGFDKFLYHGTEGAIERGIANPLNWWSFGTSSYSRTDLLAEYFDEMLYAKRTFGDLKEIWPYLIINATDLSTGQRFNFTPAQFRCIGSDIEKFRLAYAIAASAAYPVFFPSIALKNFNYPPPVDIHPGRGKGPYVPLSDGGLVDNFATRVYLDLLERGALIGNPKGTLRPLARAFVFIRIDASAQLGTDFADSADSASTLRRLDRSFAVASTQQIADSDTLLTDTILQRLEHEWPKKCDKSVQFYEIDAQLQEAPVDLKARIKAELGKEDIPTRWTLPDKVIDLLIEAGQRAISSQQGKIKKVVELLKASDKKSPVCYP